MSDGIEIHFEPKTGRLELACEPEAFAPYREIARKQLAECPDIRLDQVIEIDVIDSNAYVARSAKHRSLSRTILLAAAFIAIGGLAAFGAVVLIGRLAA